MPDDCFNWNKVDGDKKSSLEEWVIKKNCKNGGQQLGEGKLITIFKGWTLILFKCNWFALLSSKFN